MEVSRCEVGPEKMPTWIVHLCVQPSFKSVSHHTGRSSGVWSSLWYWTPDLMLQGPMLYLLHYLLDYLWSNLYLCLSLSEKVGMDQKCPSDNKTKNKTNWSRIQFGSQIQNTWSSQDAGNISMYVWIEKRLKGFRYIALYPHSFPSPLQWPENSALSVHTAREKQG